MGQYKDKSVNKYRAKDTKKDNHMKYVVKNKEKGRQIERKPQEQVKTSVRPQEEEVYQLEGRNPILEALNHDKQIDKILVRKGEVEGTLRLILAKARDKGIIVQEVAKVKLDEMAFSHNHQGVIALCPAQDYVDVQDILAYAADKGEDPFIVILDSVTDTHNLGAIIRTAEAAGCHGVIIPKRRAAGLTGIVSKVSAGAIQHIPIARVTNIARVIEELKLQNIWVACGDMNGQDCFSASLTGPIALVIGSEGEGVGRLIREKCDFTLKIPMYGKMQSLNASVAAGILVYEVVRQRKG